MIRVIVVGAGHWGPNLIRNFHNHQSSVVSCVVDQDQGTLGRIATRFPGVPTASSVEEALASHPAEAVVVATPTATHYQVARTALEAGLHVLVEKPITTSAEQARSLCVLARDRRLVLMVGHVFVYNAAIRKVKDYLNQDLLGPLHYISMVRTNLGPIRSDVNAAWDLASHDLAIVDYWLGAPPSSVAAAGHDWINAGVDDAVFATLWYPGDVMVNLHASWLNPRKVREITVVGERRMLVFDDMNLVEPVRIYDSTVSDAATSYADSFGSFRASIRQGDISIPRIVGDEPLRAECEHFVSCVASGSRPLTAGEDGLVVVCTLEAIQRSLAAGSARIPVEVS